MEQLPQLVIFAAFFAVMYFFFFRPQIKKQKEQEKFITELGKGDEVVTSGGIIGKVDKVEGEEVVVVSGGKTVLRIHKSMISNELTKSLNASKSNA